MIISILRGGLGNQLFELAASRHLSRVLGQSLRVDTRFLAIDRSRRSFGLSGLLPVGVPVGAMAHFVVRALRFASIRGRAIAWFVTNPLWSYFAESDGLPAARWPRSRRSLVTILEGYRQSLSYSSALLAPLRASLASTEPRTVEEAELATELGSRIVLAVHVRRGDYSDDAQVRQVHGVCGPEYFVRGVRFVDGLASIDRIFVFSDDLGWVRTHVDLGPRARYVNASGRMSDMEEFRTMARCHHFVISNSTFSWWAAQIANNPGKIVVAPERWFAHPSMPNPDLYPPDWHRLK